MKIRNYLLARIVDLCFIYLIFIMLMVLMYFIKASSVLMIYTAIFYNAIVVLWLVVDYMVINKRLKRLSMLVESLPEKYLIAEVLPKPEGIIEESYYNIIKTISKSAIGVAENANRDKQDYCEYVEAWVHEIKTPLTAMSLIMDNDCDVRKLKRELKRADNLTENILYYARLRSVEKDTKVEPLYIRDIVDNTVKNQMDLLIAAHISVEVTGDFEAITDGKLLGFMIGQLLVNCAKYCKNSKVEITAKDGVLTVKDNGPGIPDYELPRVTKRGYTGTTNAATGGSTGMGLYIVNQLCEQLNITFSIESVYGEYTKAVMEFRN